VIRLVAGAGPKGSPGTVDADSSGASRVRSSLGHPPSRYFPELLATIDDPTPRKNFIGIFSAGCRYPRTRFDYSETSGPPAFATARRKNNMASQKIKPFLWYETQAEDAARFYCSLIKDSKILNVVPGPTGSAMLVEIELAGVKYLAMNGGPHYKLTPAFSLSVECDTQAEIDELWEKLSDGGSKVQCGWLVDKYGLSWQVVPSMMPKWMSDPKRAGAVMQALMQMTKLEIAKLQAAYDAA
jgi:predicted 3-demethylubiquinone-9 3-methyltransferase (glyoxalase superfamily)